MRNTHPALRLSHLLLLAMTLSSCTCGQEAPPPPPAALPPTRPPGFQATSAPTAAPTQPPAATPTAASAAVTATPDVSALPSNFPKDITVMEGSELAQVQKLGGGASNVLFTTEAEPAKVFSYYKDDLKAKGHEVTQQYQTHDQSFLSFKKGDLVTNVVIAPDPNNPKKKVVAIMYYEEQPAEEF